MFAKSGPTDLFDFRSKLKSLRRVELALFTFEPDKYLSMQKQREIFYDKKYFFV